MIFQICAIYIWTICIMYQNKLYKSMLYQNYSYMRVDDKTILLIYSLRFFTVYGSLQFTVLSLQCIMRVTLQVFCTIWVWWFLCWPRCWMSSILGRCHSWLSMCLRTRTLWTCTFLVILWYTFGMYGQDLQLIEHRSYNTATYEIGYQTYVPFEN